MNPAGRLPHVARALKEERRVRLVAYGDSISETDRTPNYFGGASKKEANWLQVLCARLASPPISLDVMGLNWGIGGQNSYEALGRIDWLWEQKPDLVLLALGANDVGWHPLTAEQSISAISRIIDCIEHRGNIDVMVLITGGSNPRGTAGTALAQRNSAMRELVTQRQLPHADIAAHMHTISENGAGWASLHHGLDDCHPNDQGHGEWARCVEESLQAELHLEGVHPCAPTL